MTTILRTAGLKPAGGPWVDTVSSFTAGDGANLGTGVQVAGSTALVLNGDDLASGGLSNYTFAQPFTLDLGHGATVPAIGSNATLSGRFTAQPDDPVLGAEQLLAGLSFVHYENASLTQARGVVVEPPAGWRPSGPFLETLLGGLADNPALMPVTLTQLLAQVPVGGNHEPAVRHLQSGPASRGITTTSANKIATQPPTTRLLRRCRAGPPARVGALVRQSLGHRGALVDAAGPGGGAQRVRPGLRLGDGQDHAGQREHRDLHVPSGRHSHHRALQRARTRST